MFKWELSIPFFEKERSCIVRLRVNFLSALLPGWADDEDEDEEENGKGEMMATITEISISKMLGQRGQTLR